MVRVVDVIVKFLALFVFIGSFGLLCMMIVYFKKLREESDRADAVGYSLFFIFLLSSLIFSGLYIFLQLRSLA